MSADTEPRIDEHVEDGDDERTTDASATDPREVVRGWMSRLWSDRRIGLGVAAGVAGLWGLLAAWWTPRGPLTSAEAIWSIVICLVVGALAGLAMRSRWTIAVAPLVFAVVFESARLGTDGPTVDGIHVSTYGMIAFVTGRGFHALLALLPMVLGAAYGAGAARAIEPEGDAGARRVGRIVRRSVAVLTTLGLLALTVALARPARTDPIVDADGNRVPGSIAELTTVEVDGHDLAMMIRGHSVDNPVLLFLAGGPGGTELGAMRTTSARAGAVLHRRHLGPTRGRHRPTPNSTPPTRSRWTASSTTPWPSPTICANGSVRTRSTSQASPGARRSASSPFKRSPSGIGRSSGPVRW